MPNFIISPNMNLPVPTPGIDPGPDYATNLSSSLQIIDQHDHSPGSGVPITPSGLNINSNLSMSGNNLTLIKTINFSSQSGSLAGVSPNLGCIYVAGNELYYNDESGNVIPITKTGSVNAGAGSITGLPSGTASASYSSGSGTFVWQSATNTPASLDFGSAILRNSVALSHGLTLSPPNAISSDYSIVFPSPNTSGSNSFLTYDTSNNISTGPAVLGALTTSNLSASAGIVGTQLASQTITQNLLATRSTGSTVGIGGVATCAAFSASISILGVSPVGNTVTITTTGRPVKVGLMPPSGGTLSSLDSTANAAPRFLIINTTSGASYEAGWTDTNAWHGSPSQIGVIDFPTSGTYTYQLYIGCGNNPVGFSTSVNNVVLYAYEL